ncbi:MAG TPA: outer membrane protein assembly factor BamB [Casimicrobiaceae bacterium]|nr:outer membrane protein assembly factor BamB [Casimicrobiaceae bacterium]
MLRARTFTLCALVLTASGCATIQSWIPSIPAPSFDWLFGKSNKPGPLPTLNAKTTPQLNWQVSVGKAAPGLAPAITTSAIYAAASDGSLVRVDPVTGRVVWRANAGTRISAGPGADDQRVVVGTDKGDVIAFDAEGKAAWTARVSSEVVAPPRIAEGVVVVFSGDGRIYGLNAGDGRTRWVNARTLPPLIIRNTAGGVAARGGIFTGTPGGRLLALDALTGTIGWEGAVANPKGATELERIADVTSLPYVDGRSVCAVAYQGRVACFDIERGTLIWSRDLSSLTGLAGDERNIYVTDDKGNVHALDKSSGASVWKQDVLAPRKIGGPQLVGAYVGIIDVEGYLHLLAASDGTYVGRLATDGRPPTTQPELLAGSGLWLSDGGTLYSVTAR